MERTAADRSGPTAPTELQADTPPFTSAFIVQVLGLTRLTTYPEATIRHR
jgi:hypothetical protein